MNVKYIKRELELIRSATIKASDEGADSGDNNTLAWCLTYINDKVSNIRRELERMKG